MRGHTKNPDYQTSDNQNTEYCRPCQIERRRLWFRSIEAVQISRINSLCLQNTVLARPPPDDFMFKLLFSLTLKRASLLIALAGFVSFSASFGLLMVFAFHWTSVAIHTVSETALTVVLAAVISQFTMSVTGALLTRHQGREIEQLRTAIDSMPQGMCMFDRSERLVVCNTQYYEMYGLTSADVIPGSTLSDVLARRVAKGTFSRNPDDYRKEFLAAVALGRTI